MSPTRATILSMWLLTACGGAQTGGGRHGPPRAADFYPLAEGSAWSYDVDDSVSTVLAIARVHSRSGRRAMVVDPGGALVPYEVRDDGIFRPDKNVYLLRDPLEVGASWSSSGEMTARITAIDRVIEVPAGRFEGCLEVVQDGGESEGLRITTTYCREVGPVKVEAVMRLSGGRAATTTGVLRGWVAR